jgi:hypothetical protein
MIAIIIGTLLVATAGVAKAVMDKLQFHWERSIFKLDPERWPPEWWNPALSWSRKYREGSMTEERFPGSKTVFVGLTDAWHGAQLVQHLALFTGISVGVAGCSSTLEIIGVVVTQRVLFGVLFELFFKRVLEQKKSEPNG